MSEYTTISLRKEFVADVEAYIEDEPFGSVKEFVKHVVVREMETDEPISAAEAKQIATKLRELGYME
jgi:Arc/MetJ-type ribon-helix-helix transcriptional regulator